VNITAIHGSKSEQGFQGRLDLPPGVPDIFREFFGGPFGQSPFGQSPRPRGPSQRSQGSGFILSADGYILTNNHVINDADEILVRLSDRSEYVAKVVGADPMSDLALLKVEPDGRLPFVKVGRSDALERGQWVVAIGAPFGFDYSVTAGVVSATGRSLPNENYVPFIQTDVAINPGNSGGPLFDLEGQVVGVNSQIYTRSGGFMGVSFAIPIDVAMEVVGQIKKDGKVTRGWLGVSIQEVTRELAESFNLSRPAGALVADVIPGSPAASVGLQPGDVITAFNGNRIVASGDLPHFVGRVVPGEEGELAIVRDGKKQTVRVRIAALPDDPDDVASGPALQDHSASASDNPLGVEVRPLNETEKERHGVTSGMIVTRVYGDVGVRLSLRPGDVIASINGRRMDSLESFNKAMRDLPDNRSISIRVVRDGRASFRSFRLR
jgi:serine protease Do